MIHKLIQRHRQPFGRSEALPSFFQCIQEKKSWVGPGNDAMVVASRKPSWVISGIILFTLSFKTEQTLNNAKYCLEKLLLMEKKGRNSAGQSPTPSPSMPPVL